MNPIEVLLELGGATVRAGTLWSHRRRGTESASFADAGDYLARPDAYQLDPHLAPPSVRRGVRRRAS